MTVKITIPTADLNRDMDINMTEICYAESRIDEIATVNTHKAPELMACYIKAYTWCTEHITNITSEMIKAETAADFRKAEIILEEVPRVLKEKGITGKSNEDYRNAVIAMDKKHIELRDRANRLAMYQDMFKGKLASLDRSYMAIRKVFGTGMDFRNPNLGSNHSPATYNPDYMKTNPQDIQTEITSLSPVTLSETIVTIQPNRTIREGFGRPKDY